MEDAAFPVALVGPVLLREFRRFAALCAFVAMDLPF
jgi:hypothetical protein